GGPRQPLQCHLSGTESCRVSRYSSGYPSLSKRAAGGSLAMPVLGKVLSYVGRALSGELPAPSQGPRPHAHGTGTPSVPALVGRTGSASAFRGPPAPAPT